MSRKGGGVERDLIPWITLQMAAMSRTGFSEASSLKLHLGVQYKWHGPNHLDHILLLFQPPQEKSWIRNRTARNQTTAHVKFHSSSHYLTLLNNIPAFVFIALQKKILSTSLICKVQVHVIVLFFPHKSDVCLCVFYPNFSFVSKNRVECIPRP